MEFKEKLIEKFKNYGFELTENQAEKFCKYYAILVEENSKYNLTAITSADEVITKHFIDSVLPLSLFGDGEKILDIGSGAGFPAVPLSIMNPELKITAIDAVNKKVNFINMVAPRLNLSNLKAIHSRAEDFIKKDNCRESFDIVTSRAVANFSTISEYSLPFLELNGKMIAYKGSNALEELEVAKNAIKILGGKTCDILNFSLEDMERKIVIIQKVSHTPAKYPRSQNKPRINPL